jgi:hypothetical protein
MRVEFTVRGLPPKKDGAGSMWGKPTEIPRIRALRRAAWEALGGTGPFKTTISLELELHVPAAEIVAIGDLDNFVTGVCDGLMAANGNRWRDHLYPGLTWEGIQPSGAVAIEDDGNVVSIVARKVPERTGEAWYEVRLDGHL